MSADAPRRKARVLATPSDVFAGRGLWIAAAVSAVAGVAAVFATLGAGGLQGPGPLSRSHQRAELGCDSCHGEHESPSKACVGCHGAHASTRPAHRALAREGKLACATCHGGHQLNEGVTLLPDGRTLRYGSGWERETDVTTAFVAPREVSVPVIPASVCGQCHNLGSPTDPIAACLLAGHEGDVENQPTVCFDEHRLPASRGDVGPARDGAWEAARTVAAVAPRGSGGAPTAWLLGAVALGLGTWGSIRVALRRRDGRLTKQPDAIVRASDVVRLPQIDTTTCLGCYACVDACPYDVLEVRRFVAVVARAEDCCGLTLCEQHCPNGSLVVRVGEPIDDRPRVSDTLESRDVPGLYLAGDLTGLPLIKNAINQGAVAVRELAKTLPKKRRQQGLLDVLIVGAGPAGISAALAAKEQGLSAVTLEQASVAFSIRSFPRGKLVFDQPLGVPLVGELWLEEATKEELLSKWLRIVRKEQLPIDEGVRVVSIGREAEGSFLVRAEDAQGSARDYRATRIVLATGRRGSPRRLEAPIDPDAEASVFYGLADARSFAGQTVLVVGLGDSAMETAIALSHQPETRVVVAYRGGDFRRGKARNISELRRAIAASRVELRLNAEVRRVRRGQVELSSEGKVTKLACDSVIVHVGALPPWAFLEQVGIRRPGRPAPHLKGEDAS